MITLITADWHLSELPKDRYRFKAIEWILDYISKNDIERMIMLGDLTHNKNHHPDTLVNDVVKLINDISTMCELIILQGNHDYVEADTPFFHFVRLLEGVTWIQRPTLMPLTGLGVCGFLPHTRDHKQSWAYIKRDWAEVPLIFAHNAFEGAVSETGKHLSGIPLSVLPDHARIISGDIHKPQNIGRLTYVGSPYTQKFGDDYDPRILLIENDSDNRVDVIDEVEVPGPQKRLVDIADVSQLRKFRFDKGDMIKVRYHMHADERDKWPEIKETIMTHFGNNVQISAVLEQEELARRPDQLAIRSDAEVLRGFGEQQELSPEMMVTGFEILNET